MDVVSFRGDAVPAGASGEIFNVNNAFINNAGDVIYDARLSGAGSNDAAVFFGPAGGVQTAIAVKGTPAGAGNFGAFSKLTLNNLGNAGFESLVGTTPGHFANTGGAVLASAQKGAASPLAGSRHTTPSTSPPWPPTAICSPRPTCSWAPEAGSRSPTTRSSPAAPAR
ncbi:hypothetical protein HZ994_06590 [Akkermansiaceae bacterium]|nr:hypothetical protein HZ994_06590 [Akkermansiaceae bacterium]